MRLVQRVEDDGSTEVRPGSCPSAGGFEHAQGRKVAGVEADGGDASRAAEGKGNWNVVVAKLITSQPSLYTVSGFAENECGNPKLLLSEEYASLGRLDPLEPAAAPSP
jgi:hypothetical protein